MNLVPAATPANGVIWDTAPSFASGQMPTQLGGVRVTVNRKPAYVYFFCSVVTSPVCIKDQINVLTPLDNALGELDIVVTSGTSLTPAFAVTIRTAAPSFLLFDTRGHVVATHANNALVGPTTLFPGYSSPAKPGEVVVLYAVGFGLPTTPLTSGSASQSGLLPAPPVCQIGRMPAALIYAALISPGLYQLNLTVPLGAPNGENEISCDYGSSGTGNDVLITVQQ